MFNDSINFRHLISYIADYKEFLVMPVRLSRQKMRIQMNSMRAIIVLLTILLYPVCLRAEYTPTELFVIGWGDGPDEFIAYGAHDIDPGTPEDSTDDYFETGSGPSTAFVDNYKNIIITNSQHGQWKGFDNDGNLIFDFSRYSNEYKKWMWSGDLSEIYVDSSKNIYSITCWRMPLIFKINYESVTIDTLRLVKSKTESLLCALNWTYDGNIMFFWHDLGWVTYKDGEIYSGGSWGVKLDDYRFYSIKFTEPDEVIIYSDFDPDIRGVGSDRDSATIKLGVDNVVWVELLNTMEPTHLYFTVYYYTEYSYFEIWKCDFGYNPVEKIVPPAEDSYYWSATPKPFIMADGDIYEFRCLEDGMHIFRWRRE